MADLFLLLNFRYNFILAIVFIYRTKQVFIFVKLFFICLQIKYFFIRVCVYNINDLLTLYTIMKYPGFGAGKSSHSTLHATFSTNGVRSVKVSDIHFAFRVRQSSLSTLLSARCHGVEIYLRLNTPDFPPRDIYYSPNDSRLKPMS